MNVDTGGVGEACYQYYMVVLDNASLPHRYLCTWDYALNGSPVCYRGTECYMNITVPPEDNDTTSFNNCTAFLEANPTALATGLGCYMNAASDMLSGALDELGRQVNSLPESAWEFVKGRITGFMDGHFLGRYSFTQWFNWTVGMLFMVAVFLLLVLPMLLLILLILTEAMFIIAAFGKHRNDKWQELVDWIMYHYQLSLFILKGVHAGISMVIGLIGGAVNKL